MVARRPTYYKNKQVAAAKSYKKRKTMPLSGLKFVRDLTKSNTGPNLFLKLENN